MDSFLQEQWERQKRKAAQKRASTHRLYVKRRKYLLKALGGKCSWPTCKVSYFQVLEVDHVNGCTWNQRSANSAHRMALFIKEYQAGVPLRLLCKKHNAALNQHTHGTRASGRTTHRASEAGLCQLPKRSKRQAASAGGRRVPF